MAQIIPAILTDQVSDLKEKLEALKGLTDWVQIDIMDGIFVPQTSIALDELANIDHDFQLDIHLMVNNPEQYLAACEKIKAKRVIFQLEGTEDPDGVIEQIKALGFEVGIGLNPETPLKNLELYLAKIDTVLLLSVNPGKQGQAFIPEVLDKLKGLRAIDHRIKIEVDGGINLKNISEVVNAGADYIVVGSAIVKEPDMVKALNDLKSKI